MGPKEGQIDQLHELSELEIKMLEAETFHVDGWTSPRGHSALARLEKFGYVRTFRGGDSQYTAINARRTDEGAVALAKIKGKL